ncbi:hypothetical protein HGA91_04900 [candidate division WWE3 bacterium]|nr:hypothetical protein [candidate division WWE3 bacterium]
MTTARRRKTQQQIVSRSPKATMMWWAALIGAGSLFAIQVTLSARVATNGEEIKELQTKQTTYETENRELRREIALLGSMIRVENVAVNDLHMVKAYNNVLYLPADPSGPIASNQ